MASTLKLVSAAALGVFALAPFAALEASAAPAAQSVGTAHQDAGSTGSNTGSGKN